MGKRRKLNSLQVFKIVRLDITRLLAEITGETELKTRREDTFQNPSIHGLLRYYINNNN